MYACYCLSVRICITTFFIGVIIVTFSFLEILFEFCFPLLKKEENVMSVVNFTSIMVTSVYGFE